MDESKLLIVPTSETVGIFNQLSRGTARRAPATDDEYLQTDLFCSFYLQNPVLKEIGQVPHELWTNYFLLEGLLGYSVFKNIQSFTKGYADATYWLVQKFIDEYRLVRKKNVLKTKKQVKKTLNKILISVNKYLRELEPLLEITRGHNIAPISLRQVTGEKILQLAQRLQKPKIREIIKIFVHSNIKEPQRTTQDEEVQAHNIFYINNPTQREDSRYKNWLCKEISGHKEDKIYETQLTAYVNPGSFVSRTGELESLSFSINLLEIARMQRRNCVMIVTNDKPSEKTYVFKNNGQVEVFENGQCLKFSFLEGMVALVGELLIGQQPKKQRFSLFSSGGAKRKKIFKKPAEFIKFG